MHEENKNESLQERTKGKNLHMEKNQDTLEIERKPQKISKEIIC